jgi:hypothetical protein
MSSTNKEGSIEISKALLDKEDWDTVIKELPEYENSKLISSFLSFLKKSEEDLSNRISKYF